MVKVAEITKKFGGVVALDNISFELKKGEVVGLLGPNGAGKTTCMRVIAGFYTPDSGTVTQENNFKIGYLPENNPLYQNSTVEEYLNFICGIKNIENPKSAIDEVVKKAFISEVFYKEISTLSKGFRQRIGLAQAILGNPDLLILDEPTEGLDPNQREDIRNLIKQIGKEKTVLLSSHVLDEVQKTCERVIIINKGKIVLDSPVKKLEMGSEIAIYLKAKGKGIEKELKGLKDIERVEKNGDEEYLIFPKTKEDLRPTIIKLATKNKWELLEIYSKKKSLEEAFKEITA